MVSIMELRMKEVINLADGKRIGFINDLEINLEKGRIEAIIVPKEGRFLKLFNKDNDYTIPWKKIVKIGQDVILVDLRTDLKDNVKFDNEDYYNTSNTIFNSKTDKEDDR
jgi:YlmC/YmxH family sporulation protein